MPDPIPRNDAYRAVIEDITNFEWHVVAKGHRIHCENYLAEWLERNPLQPLHIAYVLKVMQRIPGPPVPDVILGREVAS